MVSVGLNLMSIESLSKDSCTQSKVVENEELPTYPRIYHRFTWKLKSVQSSCFPQILYKSRNVENVQMNVSRVCTVFPRFADP